MKPLHIFLIGLAVILLSIILYFIFRKRKIKHTYSKIHCIMTNTELTYYDAFVKILSGTNYILHYQTPLSAIVKRNEPHSFQPELSRVIDFCILSYDFTPLLCIEINDRTHLMKHRIERDEKVKAILKSAKIPLLTIWTTETFDIKIFAAKIRDFGIKLDIRKINNEFKR